MKYKLSEFDMVYISYDEPNAEKNWADLLSKVPWAKRVHGVKGFDTAHREAARISSTKHVITVDGDNIIDPAFVEQEIIITSEQEQNVFSWCSINIINGLKYGNGGIKLWPIRTLKNLSSHEYSNKLDSVDFCWDINYFQMNDAYSITVPNGSPFQAFRAGYREGIKMTLNKGNPVSRVEFHNMLNIGNVKRLRIWCSVGADVENGLWSMYGARLGCKHGVFEQEFIEKIKDYEWFDSFWGTIKNKNDEALKTEISELGDFLRKELKLDIAEMDENSSMFFKSVYVNPERKGLMMPEVVEHV